MPQPVNIQGLNLEQLGKEFGLPLYVYDTEIIKRQYQRLKSAFAALDTRIKYPVKALNNLNILKFLRGLGAGLDTVSIGEVQLGLKAGFAPSEIIFTPNGISFAELKQAVSLGVMINIDNIPMLERFGAEYGGSVACCIRFNPHLYGGSNSKIQTGHIDSKFGISVFQQRHVERIVAATGIQVTGIHVHTGSEILDSSVYLQGANILFEIAKTFKDLTFIDFGSGFKVPYQENDVVTDLNDLGLKLSEAYQEFKAEFGRDVQIWFEPGKYLVSESGYFLMQVNVVKPTPSTVFVGVDSGLNHFIRPMMYGGYHDMVNLSNPDGPLRVYSVVGYICETDTFGSDRKLTEVREGDVICLKNAGAYGFTMSSNYNSRPRPAEVMIENGQAKLIRRRETLDDLLATTVE